MELLEAIDQGRVAVPTLFIGETNINMALIAQRMGFVIVDQDRNPDGSINKDKTSFTVVGVLDQIRSKVAQIQASESYRNLSRRQRRLELAPRPIG